MQIRPLLFILFSLGLAAPASAANLSAGDVFGSIKTYTVKKHEDLSSIAQKFGIGIIELEAANPGVDVYKPKPGTELTIPEMHVIPSITHEGIVINLEISRLFYFKDNNEILSFPVASGKPGWETPVAATKVVAKRKDPIWTPTDHIREENPDLPDFIPAGPDNPLGKYAIHLGLNGIMLHGTNAPSSVGKKVSHGCMRMYASDIEALFKSVKIGTPVLLMKRSHEMGWSGNTLYLQMAPKVSKAKKDALKYAPDLDLYAAIQETAGPEAVIDWNAVDDAIARADGIPLAIAERPETPFYGPPVPAKTAEPAKPRRAALDYLKQLAFFN